MSTLSNTAVLQELAEAVRETKHNGHGQPANAPKYVYLFSEVEQAEELVNGSWTACAGCWGAREPTWGT